jgi:hypothetical protein
MKFRLKWNNDFTKIILQQKKLFTWKEFDSIDFVNVIPPEERALLMTKMVTELNEKFKVEMK